MDEIKRFRAFIAIDVSEEARALLTELLKKLKKEHLSAQIKLVKPESLHITMKFLGNITSEQYTQLTQKIINASKEIKAFQCCFSSFLLLPSAERPRVLALKAEPIPGLIQINQLLEDIAESCEIKSEKRAFLPHLTLARIKTDRAINLEGIKLPLLEQEVNELILYRSDSKTGGSIYTPLKRIKLS